jgi:DNA polymerase-3 subunit alpha
VKLHGVDPSFAAEQFDQIEKFAGYGFNKSHAAAYSLISYICMWLKVNYPAEFFAGVLSYVKEERRSAVLADMQRLGITLMPPDINDSSNTFEVLHSTALLAPYNSVKMVSDNAAAAIMAAKGKTVETDADGKIVLVDKPSRFLSIADFEARVERRKCNSRVRENLNAVGAFSRIESGQLPANDASRRAVQMELMPGLIQEAVVIDKPMIVDKFAVSNLNELITEYKACDKCDLAGLCHPKPKFHTDNRFFIVLNGPGFKEEAKDEMGHGSSADAIYTAMTAAGLNPSEAYITSLIKSPKPEGSKDWPAKTMTECPVWLDREIETLRPPLIVIMGHHVLRHFCGDMKGGLNEHAGKVIYDKKRGCNFLIGVNPGAIYFDPGKQADLNAIMSKVPALLPE